MKLLRLMKREKKLRVVKMDINTYKILSHIQEMNNGYVLEIQNKCLQLML